jgi:hypothetical protein
MRRGGRAGRLLALVGGLDLAHEVWVRGKGIVDVEDLCCAARAGLPG